ncbi:hypothetical protein DW241_03930, partial [Hungatella hathewayi]
IEEPSKFYFTEKVSHTPIGFTMELAQHENALSAFSSLTSDQQRQVIDGAKQMKTRQEMRNYVENQFK